MSATLTKAVAIGAPAAAVIVAGLRAVEDPALAAEQFFGALRAFLRPHAAAG
jgi:hypothetical protein